MLHKSDRCKEDLKEYLLDKSPIGVVFQPFLQKLNLANEVRLFVYQGNLVAVSAIDEPNNHLDKEELLRIKSYVGNLTRLNRCYPNYVACLCVLGPDEIIFIEINPYDPDITESFLFDWEEDINILFADVSPEVPAYRFE